MKNLFITLLVVFTTASSEARATDLETLFKACGEWEKINFNSPSAETTHINALPQITFCLGFVSAWKGAAAGNCALQEAMGSNVYSAIKPFNNLSREQIAQMTINYAREHPEKWKDNPMYFTRDIIQKDFLRCN